MTAAQRARELAWLHAAPELLVMVNVWDAASAAVVAGLPGCRAVATASHSIAAAHGYPDGEQIPLDRMIAAIATIARAVQQPLSADLEEGYGAPGETVRRAIGAGAVGGNLEDAMAPLDKAVGAVEEAVAAGEAEGVPFVINARTDVFLEAGSRDPGAVLADAVTRGRAFLEAGATCVFVPGGLDEATVAALVEAFGRGRLSVLAGPGSLPQARLAALGVGRVSFGPWTQRVAMTALAHAGVGLLAGGALPVGTTAPD